MSGIEIAAFLAPRRLIITQSDSTITIDQRNPSDSVSYMLYFDGRAVAAPEPLGGGRTNMSGHWLKKRFVVSRDLPNGAVLTEGYELSRHGQRLLVYVKISAPSGGPPGREIPELKRVYYR